MSVRKRVITKSPVRENRTQGSVGGSPSNGRSYPHKNLIIVLMVFTAVFCYSQVNTGNTQKVASKSAKNVSNNSAKSITSKEAKVILDKALKLQETSNSYVGEPRIINKTKWVPYGPTLTITCGQKNVQPISVQPQIVTIKTAKGSLIKWRTPLVSTQPPIFNCDGSCGKGLKTYRLKSRLLTIEYTKPHSSNCTRKKITAQTVDTTQVLVDFKPCSQGGG